MVNICVGRCTQSRIDRLLVRQQVPRPVQRLERQRGVDDPPPPPCAGITKGTENDGFTR